ncbi:MAG TPA: cysteine synthase family protein [Terriglobales bacterium]|jgi:cysteine synthase B|nr:cysteine synthase family protein [Terriglobales bacterium]
MPNLITKRPEVSESKADAAAGKSAHPDRSKASPLGRRSLDMVGNTPLLRLDRIAKDFPGLELLGKAEWYNPGGSVKDRAASRIVAEARAAGKLGPGISLLDSTSGNTGIAYAMIGAAENFPVTLCMPENVSPERKRILHAYGATIIYTDPGEGSDGSIQRAHEIYAEHPEKYFYADQYSNPANWQAHYHGTGNEIWQQTEGRITHFVAMLGTSGTFVGTTRRLKELNSNIRCISLQPDSPFHGIEGAKHMETAIVPKIYDASLADEDLGIATEDAHAMAVRLAREEGLLVGISAGAAVVGALQVARSIKEDEGAVIVTILPDSGDKYLSELFWERA